MVRNCAVPVLQGEAASQDALSSTSVVNGEDWCGYVDLLQPLQKVVCKKTFQKTAHQTFKVD